MVGCDDLVVTVTPMRDRIAGWRRYLSETASEEELQCIRRCSTTGRPGGDGIVVEQLENLTGREPKKRKPGPKPGIK